MPRVAYVFMSICLLMPLASGCQTASHAKASPAPPASFWTADDRPEPMEVTAMGADERSVRFASLRESESGPNTLSRLLGGGADRIPLPESKPQEIRQIDPPRQSAANSIGAF